jgi:hypothetical protein
MDRAALPGGLTVAPERITWRLAAVKDVIVESPAPAKTLVLDARGWPGHVPARRRSLTAEDEVWRR